MNDVYNSLLDLFVDYENSCNVVARRWYVITRASQAIQMNQLLVQSSLAITRLGPQELGLLVKGCLSGMGYGHEQEVYQAREYSKFLELNHRVMQTMEVVKFPRRANMALIQQMMRSGCELDISLWITPVSQQEAHSRLQTQLSRFEGSRLVAIEKGEATVQ